MKHQVPIRIVVKRPLPGVAMMIQRGKFEFLPPVSRSDERFVYEFDITVDTTESRPNFLGEYSQGPENARFIYVNSGTYADQHSIWGRRAKVSLMDITSKQIQQVISKAETVLETEFEGVGRDGGPTCASVKGIVWKVTPV